MTMNQVIQGVLNEKLFGVVECDINAKINVKIQQEETVPEVGLEREILQALSKTSKACGKMLLEKIKENPEVMKWNDKGQLIVEGKEHPNMLESENRRVKEVRRFAEAQSDKHWKDDFAVLVGTKTRLLQHKDDEKNIIYRRPITHN
ncbi:hypothetical protein AC249_AIPGENE16815 [Exaiptasia diaphana]|nr:hypothetical protein AC249_AIPGENE16815 [Exaiptasia diaphana]